MFMLLAPDLFFFSLQINVNRNDALFEASCFHSEFNQKGKLKAGTVLLSVLFLLKAAAAESSPTRRYTIQVCVSLISVCYKKNQP